MRPEHRSVRSSDRFLLRDPDTCGSGGLPHRRFVRPHWRRPRSRCHLYHKERCPLACKWWIQRRSVPDQCRSLSVHPVHILLQDPSYVPSQNPYCLDRGDLLCAPILSVHIRFVHRSERRSRRGHYRFQRRLPLNTVLP